MLQLLKITIVAWLYSNKTLTKTNSRLCSPDSIVAYRSKALIFVYKPRVWDHLQMCVCCWVASVVSDSVRPHRRQPTRLPCPWDSPGKNAGVGCHFLLQCMEVKSESRSVVSDSWRPHGLQPYPAPPSMGFSRQEYWSGVPLPSPSDDDTQL